MVDTGSKCYIQYFATGFLLVCFLLLLIPKDKVKAYGSLRQDFEKGNWVYTRLHHDLRPVNVAFIGTSHTEGNVNDELIEKYVRARMPEKLHIVNLGIPQHGRNLHYVIAKELFNTKSPGLLVLEVKAYESRVSHPMYSRLVDIVDLIRPNLALNPMFMRDLLSAMRWQLMQYVSHVELPGAESVNYGYRNNDRGIALDAERMAKLVAPLKKIATVSYLGGRADWLEFSFPHSYIEKIVNLAKRYNTKLVFLYLPYYGAPDVPRDIEFYSQFGEIWYPPREVLSNPYYWKDAGHLNDMGAKALVSWLSQCIIDIVNNQ